MDVRLPDGTVISNVPDNISKDELVSKLKSNGMAVPAEWLSQTAQKPSRNIGGVGDLLAGGVRGAGSIGATLLTPLDALTRAIGADNSYFGPNGSILGRTDRRQAMTDALGSMGADTNSYAFGAGKLGSEVAGTLGVGGALGNAARALGAAPRVVQALSSSGMIGGTSAAGTLPLLENLALRSGAGAVTGGASSALIDPSTAGTGAAIGAALPPALKALGAAGRTVGNAVSGARAAVSDSAAADAAVRKILSATGQQPALNGATGKFGDIPVTAAAQNASPELAALEQASRLRSPEAWRNFDNAQAQAVWDKVQRAGSAAENLGAARAARSQNWQDNWRAAASAFEPGATTTPSQLKAALEWPKDVQRLSNQLDQAMKSAPAANDAVMAMLQNIRGKIDQFGEGFSPAHLQQIRASLSGKAWDQSADALKRVPRDNPATVSVLRAVDDMLTKATGGRWSSVTQGYAADSAAVDAARSAGRMMSNFVSPEGNLLGRTTAGGALPDITAPRLERALNLTRGPSGASMLDESAQNAVGQALAALKAQQVVQQLKRSASAGGGSDTIPNLMALAGTSRPGLLNELVQMGRNAATGRTERALAGLLTSPDDLAAALSNQPGLLSGLWLDNAGLLAARAAPGAAASR